MFNIRRAILRARNLSKIFFGSVLLLTSPTIVAGADISERPERPNVTIAYVVAQRSFYPALRCIRGRPFCQVWFESQRPVDSCLGGGQRPPFRGYRLLCRRQIF